MITLAPRNAALERAKIERIKRLIVEPMYPVYDVAAAIAIVFIIGCIRFQFFDPSQGFTLTTTVHLLISAAAMFLIPIFFVAVAVLEIVRYRFDVEIRRTGRY